MIWNQRHYYAVAKEIRLEFKAWLDELEHGDAIMPTRALTDLAVKFAIRFKADNELFDPVDWLNKCSPNEDLYPLGELWHEAERQS